MDRNMNYRSPLERIGDYGRSIGKGIAKKKREIALTATLGTAIAGGVAGCAGNAQQRTLASYGSPVKETAPIVSEDGTKDFWRLTQDKNGVYRWVHIIDREPVGETGLNDGLSAYECRGDPPENPPRKLDSIVGGFGKGLIEQAGW